MMFFARQYIYPVAVDSSISDQLLIGVVVSSRPQRHTRVILLLRLDNGCEKAERTHGAGMTTIFFC